MQLLFHLAPVMAYQRWSVMKYTPAAPPPFSILPHVVVYTSYRLSGVTSGWPWLSGEVGGEGRTYDHKRRRL